jgi:hypothetical protein
MARAKPPAPTVSNLSQGDWQDARRTPNGAFCPHDFPRTGVVTRTKFSRARVGYPGPGSGGGGGSPSPECFVSEDAERAAGCEMALDIESVLDRGVNRKEALS